METNPYSPPETTIADPASSRENANRVVAPYRGLILWFALQLLVGISGALALASVSPELRPIVVRVRSLVIFVTFIGLAIYAYRTSLALGSKVGFLWSLAMIVPLVNLFTLFVLSFKATRACRAAGIPVGFLGPTKADITK
jgi:hypothetical protein